MTGGDGDRFAPSAIRLHAQPELVAAGFLGEKGEIGWRFQIALGTFIAIQPGGVADPRREGGAVRSNGQCGIIIVRASTGERPRRRDPLDVHCSVEFLDEFAVGDVRKFEIKIALGRFHPHHRTFIHVLITFSENFSKRIKPV